MDDNPFRPWVDRLAALFADGANLAADPAPRRIATGGPTALIFAPHPDDEVIVGALPLRLQRECGFRIVDVAVTLGSRPDRRAARWQEAAAACAALGFGLVTPDPAGLEGITPSGREADPDRWRRAVAATAALVAEIRPDLVFLPHDADTNQTHLGVHALAIEALRAVPDFACSVVETEYWGAMASPNLMIESAPADVADLVAALSLHTGEVARNPYHLRLPAWMMDNVRRGAELVGGQGAPAPAFVFATLYRLRIWRDGILQNALPEGMMIGKAASLAFMQRSASPDLRVR